LALSISQPSSGPRHSFLQKVGDRHVFVGRSRFITASLAHHLNRVSWPIARQAKGPAPTAKAQVDIRERMSGMWSKTG
jgi:DNA helicase-2/ATP-dependent DNA helicase PcrA